MAPGCLMAHGKARGHPLENMQRTLQEAGGAQRGIWLDDEQLPGTSYKCLSSIAGRELCLQCIYPPLSKGCMSEKKVRSERGGCPLDKGVSWTDRGVGWCQQEGRYQNIILFYLAILYLCLKLAAKKRSQGTIRRMFETCQTRKSKTFFFFMAVSY